MCLSVIPHTPPKPINGFTTNLNRLYSSAHIKEAYCRQGLRKKKMDYTVGKISSCREGSIFVDIISEIINTPPIAVQEQLREDTGVVSLDY